jgi:hypothetical protein
VSKRIYPSAEFRPSAPNTLVRRNFETPSQCGRNLHCGGGVTSGVQAQAFRCGRPRTRPQYNRKISQMREWS